ncbi:MAG: methyltransferase domain-containing protein [Chthoniobacterales bacterium]
MASCSGAGTRTTVAGDGDLTFPQSAPLALDLGCGNGVFLAALAAAHPGWNVLGVEKKGYRVRQARRHAQDLDNARVVQGEVVEVVSGLPAASITRVYLLFSDPWPKRRHAVRRLVQRSFASLLADRLAPHGSFFFASDSAAYTDWAENIFWVDGWQVGPWQTPRDWPPTEFEQRFGSAGVEIRRFEATR